MSLEGKVFLLSGKFSVARQEIEGKVKKNGGTVSSTFSGKVTHVLTANPDEKTAAVEKAQNQGCNIVNEGDLEKMIKGIEIKKKKNTDEEEKESVSPRKRARTASPATSSKKSKKETTSTKKSPKKDSKKKSSFDFTSPTKSPKKSPRKKLIPEKDPFAFDADDFKNLPSSLRTRDVRSTLSDLQKQAKEQRKEAIEIRKDIKQSQTESKKDKKSNGTEQKTTTSVAENVIGEEDEEETLQRKSKLKEKDDEKQESEAEQKEEEKEVEETEKPKKTKESKSKKKKSTKEKSSSQQSQGEEDTDTSKSPKSSQKGKKKNSQQEEEGAPPTTIVEALKGTTIYVTGKCNDPKMSLAEIKKLLKNCEAKVADKLTKSVTHILVSNPEDEDNLEDHSATLFAGSMLLKELQEAFEK